MYATLHQDREPWGAFGWHYVTCPNQNPYQRIFLFPFANKSHVPNEMSQGPWIYKNTLLVPRFEDFSANQYVQCSCPIWVQWCQDDGRETQVYYKLDQSGFSKCLVLPTRFYSQCIKGSSMGQVQVGFNDIKALVLERYKLRVIGVSLRNDIRDR